MAEKQHQWIVGALFGIGILIAISQLSGHSVTGKGIELPQSTGGDKLPPLDSLGEMRACDTGLLGICAEGMQRCTPRCGPCVQKYTLAEEICDGLDNDCDGQTDEEFPREAGTVEVQVSLVNGQEVKGTEFILSHHMSSLSSPEVQNVIPNWMYLYNANGQMVKYASETANEPINNPQEIATFAYQYQDSCRPGTSAFSLQTIEISDGNRHIPDAVLTHQVR